VYLTTIYARNDSDVMSVVITKVNNCLCMGKKEDKMAFLVLIITRQSRSLSKKMLMT
jgi:hypothetical protein